MGGSTVGAGGNGKGRKESPPSPTGYLGVPAAWEPSSPAAGLGSCRRGEQDELRAGSAVKVQPDSPRKLPRHGPAPLPPGLPGHTGERPLIPGQRRSRPCPLPHQRCSPATLLSPAAGQGLFCLGRSTLPPFPLRLRETSLLPPAGREN